MVSIVKEICIFMIVAQAVLFFVPGSVYVKYVRVLVGIMMIMGITGPLFGLFLSEDKKLEIGQKIEALEAGIRSEENLFAVPDIRQDIYRAVEQELKERLEEGGGSYHILDAEVAEDKVVVTVKEAERGMERDFQDEERQETIQIEPIRIGEEKETGALGQAVPDSDILALKELYGSRIGVDGRILKLFSGSPVRSEGLSIVSERETEAVYAGKGHGGKMENKIYKR